MDMVHIDECAACFYRFDSVGNYVFGEQIRMIRGAEDLAHRVLRFKPKVLPEMVAQNIAQLDRAPLLCCEVMREQQEKCGARGQHGP